MWQGFTIALREGLESFLIIALVLAYLRKTGRQALVRALIAGILASVLVCAGAGLLLSRAANQPLWEGILAAVAAILCGSFLVYMLRTAKGLKRNLERGLAAATESRWGSMGGVFLFTVLMLTREGMELTLLTATALFQLRSGPVFLGLALGACSAAAVALTWKQLGHRVPIGSLLQVSAAFLSLFLVQLCVYAVHELAEAQVLPAASAIHDATEILGPDGVIGHVVTYLLALVPTLWLLWAWLRRSTRTLRPAVPTSPGGHTDPSAQRAA
jgi:high-affinity iron transporter